MSDQDTPQTPASGEESQQSKNARQSERTSPREGREGRERSRGRRRHGGGGQPQSQHRSSEQSLNMEELRELVELISEYGFTDFELENKDVRVRLRRELAPQVINAQYAPAAEMPLAQTPAPAVQQPKAAPPAAANAAPVETQAETASAEAAPAEEGNIHVVNAPIVGTFYRSPSPKADAFVQIGSHVSKGSVLCIIEAMKLMNEIETDVDGVIAKIYVENGQPVEYGQPLFGIKVG